MDENKSRIESIDDYISQFSPQIQDMLKKMRQAIRMSAPDAQEKISYQMPTFNLHGILVHFAAHRNHIGFYPTPSGIEAFRQELAAFKTSKGAVQFPLDKPLPLDLISQIVRFRVAENLAVAKGGDKN